MHIERNGWRLLALIALGAAALGQDPSKDLRSKDHETRLAAISTLEAGERGEGEKLLVKVLADEDWEVRERAIVALGVVGSTKFALKPLLKEALEAPVRRMRLAAARSLARIDAEQAGAALSKKLGGNTARRAAEALVEVGLADLEWNGEGARAGFDERKLERLLKGKEEELQEAAGRALATSAAISDASRFADMAAHETLLVRCAAFEVAVRRPDPRFLDACWKALAEPSLTDVEERRVLAALRALFARAVELELELPLELAGMLESFSGPGARLARALVVAQESGLAERELGEAGAAPGLRELARAADVRARCAAIHALAGLYAEAEADEVMRAGGGDRSAEVRLVAVRALVRLVGLEPTAAGGPPADTGPAGEEQQAVVGGDARVAWLITRLAQDESAEVREQLAVDLGLEDRPEVVEPLIAALADPDWRVAVCAAVSLGKTHAGAAVPSLASLLEHEDWRLRGAAAIGLGRLNQAGIIEPLIAALADREPAVARSAHEGLCEASGRSDVEADEQSWARWWQENAARHVFRDRRALVERQRKFGYATPTSQVYEGLDVVVLESRGDHIESVLERAGIEYRATAAAQIPECGLHAGAVFVANCSGEVEVEDVERLQWFVRVGGYLFGSCWALSQTIEATFPGVLAKFETVSEVLDVVPASVLGDVDENPFLRGAYLRGVVPIYHLEGAHLIDVLAPERCQVLIDSPEAADRHGEGNLAAWFEAGHGVILDSVNHFALQGLESVLGLKTPEDRQAYAIDHLGLDYARLREILDEAYWKSNHRAAAQIHDDSAFNFVTNFVRDKRRRDG